MRYPAIHSLFIAIDLTSNCAYSCTYFHIQCNRLAILSFSDFEILHCPASLSTLIAINLLSCHFLILKFALSCNSFHIYCICEFSNCASSCISFHFDCNRLAILSFSNLKIVRFPAIHSTFIAIDLTSDHLGVFKLCPLLHLFPHSLQLACPPIICEFSSCASSCT